MKKLLKLTREQLQNEYFIQNGVFPAENNKDLLIAALYYGKRIDYLTQEEITNISEL
jgi:hypothetical protein